MYERLNNATANIEADGRNEDDVVNLGGSGVNIVEGYPKMNNKLEDLKREKYENKKTNVGASSVRIGGESEVISAMDVGDGYKDDTTHLTFYIKTFKGEAFSKVSPLKSKQTSIPSK